MADHIPAPDVVVVGSLNVDYTTTVPSIPRPGETVMGGDVEIFMGGKGLNQAVAAARAGATVAMVGRIGDDDGGRRLRDRLRAESIDDTWIGVDDGVPTGAAFITVDDGSENAIVVSPGANGRLTADHIAEAGPVISGAGAVLMQLEVPMEAIVAATAAATGMVVVNPAPARPLPSSVVERSDLLIPNRGELATITGDPFPRSEAEVMALAAALASAGGVDPAAADGATQRDRRIIVTLGSDGIAVHDSSGPRLVAAPEVAAVDTTGAGDCFCGSLTARLALGDRIDDALAWAMAAAAISVTRPGASDSIPTADEVALALDRR